ncbi:hypothetical protein Ndes2526B_g03575 [Nannochloris sp. 'desiccata']
MLDSGMDEEFLTQFRMPRRLFETLVNLMQGHVGKQDTNYREAIDTPRRLAVFLNFVCHANSYNQIQELFGVSIASVKNQIKDISTFLVHTFVRERKDLIFPCGEHDIEALERGFRDKWGLPGACAAIDGTHFAITKPGTGGDDYINRKGWPSLAGIFVASADCYCLEAVVGYPGCSHDARMWADSSLKERLANNTIPLKTMPKIQFNGEEIPYYLLGDPGFPISDVLIPTFDRRGGAPTADQTSFNVRHSHARVVVEHMFGQVKGRFRLLIKCIEMTDRELAVKVIMSCFILHNFLLRNGAPCPQEWVLAAQSQAAQQQPGNGNTDINQSMQQPTTAASRAAGLALRNKLLQLHIHSPHY